MSTILLSREPFTWSADSALTVSARLWWVVTALGQWIFVAYVAGFYIPMLAVGGLDGLQKAPLANGFMNGDTPGNVAVAGHVLLSIIILGGGPLQLVPRIRERFPVLHHWIGRTYLLTVVSSAAAGLYLIWSRPLFGPLVTNIATSIDGILIIVFAAFAVRHAIARDIVRHRRWALRLFMVASSVWFLRVGFRAWVFLTGGVGVDPEKFGGPFVVAWHFGQFLLPLAILELYFRARDHGTARQRTAMAGGLFAVSVVMVIGIVLATKNSWLPRLTG